MPDARTFGRWTVRLVGGVLALAVALLLVWTAWAHITWRDIPVTTLEQRYGDAELRSQRVDGVDIRYRLHGPVDGSKAVVALIHNHFFDMGMWSHWIRALRDDFTILRFDLSGHGLTGPDPSGIYTVERDVELLTGLLDALGIKTLSVVGSSLGGNVAFSFAAKHPQRTHALVLINSGGLPRETGRSGRQLPGWAEFALRLLPPAAYHRFLRWIAADSAAVDSALEQRFVDMFRRDGNRSAEISRLRQYDVGNPGPLLARVTAPSLILWGDQNPQLPVLLADHFVNKLTSATHIEKQIFPGAGHLLPVELPAASAEVARRFLLDVTRPTSR